MPATPGGVARAGAPTTLYAQVWNLGKAPAYRVRVEFYWFNPSLGISRADANLIGATWVDLGNRFARAGSWTEVRGPAGAYLSMGSHIMVRCPTTWVPQYLNNGHECLVVRVSEPMMDAVAPNQFDAAAAQTGWAMMEAMSLGRPVSTASRMYMALYSRSSGLPSTSNGRVSMYGEAVSRARNVKPASEPRRL